MGSCSNCRFNTKHESCSIECILCDNTHKNFVDNNYIHWLIRSATLKQYTWANVLMIDKSSYVIEEQISVRDYTVSRALQRASEELKRLHPKFIILDMGTVDSVDIK